MASRISAAAPFFKRPLAGPRATRRRATGLERRADNLPPEDQRRMTSVFSASGLNDAPSFAASTGRILVFCLIALLLGCYSPETSRFFFASLTMQFAASFLLLLRSGLDWSCPFSYYMSTSMSLAFLALGASLGFLLLVRAARVWTVPNRAVRVPSRHACTSSSASCLMLDLRCTSGVHAGSAD